MTRRPSPRRTSTFTSRQDELDAQFWSDTRGHEPFCTDHDHRGFCADPIKPANTNEEQAVKVTAETITDEMIRELQVIAYREVRYGLVEICNRALAAPCAASVWGRAARANCADIWNARSALDSTKETSKP